jgi:hypothetical protein
MAVADTLLEAEWLEADGLGGFASGAVRGLWTRRLRLSGGARP